MTGGTSGTYYPTLSFDGNTGDSRTVTVTVTATDGTPTPASWAVTQAKATSVLSVTPTHWEPGSAATSTEISVAVIPSASWTASTDQSWVTLSTYGGTASGLINVNVTENTTTSARTATVTVKTATLTDTCVITQSAGTVTPFCYIKNNLSYSVTLNFMGINPIPWTANTLSIAAGGTGGLIVPGLPSTVESIIGKGSYITLSGVPSLFPSTIKYENIPWYQNPAGGNRYTCSLEDEAGGGRRGGTMQLTT